MSRLYGTKPGVDPSVWRGVAFAVGIYVLLGLIVWAVTAWL